MKRERERERERERDGYMRNDEKCFDETIDKPSTYGKRNARLIHRYLMRTDRERERERERESERGTTVVGLRFTRIKMTNKRTDKQTKRARNWHRARSEDRRLENSFENSGKDRKNRNEAQTTTKKKRKVKKRKRLRTIKSLR